MTGPATLSPINAGHSGTAPHLAGLRRATRADRAAIEALQHAAYARNRDLLGVEPLPLLADYGLILENSEVWLAEEAGALAGVLILELREADVLIWSIATDPARRQAGLGRRLLADAEQRARDRLTPVVRLYTGQKLTANVAWYSRHGYQVERLEAMPDRTAVHMVKSLD